MHITLQELVEIASTHFRNTPYTRLWVFYSEESEEFFLIECEQVSLPTHNNLGSIVNFSRERYPEASDHEISITWHEPNIVVNN